MRIQGPKDPPFLQKAEPPRRRGAKSQNLSVVVPEAVREQAEAADAWDARVEGVRAEIQAGSYKVDLDALTDRLVEEELARAGKSGGE